jgi:hypothetical protein
MKVIYEFTDEDDRDKIKIYAQTEEMYCALFDFSQRLRHYIKHKEYKTTEAVGAVNDIKEEFWQIIGEKNINLDIR